MCGYSFAPLAPTRESTNHVTMRDAQGNTIKHDHQRDVSVRMKSSRGSVAEATATFEVADVKGAILSAGKLVQKGFQVTLSPSGNYLEKNGNRVELIMKKNSFYLPAMVCAVAVEQDEPPSTATGSRDMLHGKAEAATAYTPPEPSTTPNVDEAAAPKTLGGLSRWSAVN